MKKQQFKTNVKCGACVAAITPAMEKLNADWKVDLTHVDRILTVEGEISEEEVIHALESSGYKAETTV
jgi:copper chaperone